MGMKVKDIKGLKNIFCLYLRYSEEVLNLLVRKQIEQDILSSGPPKWGQVVENLSLNEKETRLIFESVVGRLTQRSSGGTLFRGFPFRGELISDTTIITELGRKTSVERIDTHSWDYMSQMSPWKNPLTYGVWEGVLLGGILGGFLCSFPLLTLVSSTILGIQLGRYVRNIARVSRKPKSFQNVNAGNLFLVVLMLLDSIGITDLSDILNATRPKYLKEEVKEWVADKIESERTKLKIEKRQDTLTIILDTVLLVQLLKCIPQRLFESRYADIKILNHSSYRDTLMPILFTGFIEQLVTTVEEMGLILCIMEGDITFEVKKQVQPRVEEKREKEEAKESDLAIPIPLQQTVIDFLIWYTECTWDTTVQQVGDELAECLDIVKQLAGVDSRYVTKFQYLNSLLLDLKTYAEGVQGYERCQRVGNLAVSDKVTAGLVETLQTVLHGILDKLDTVEVDILQSLKIQEAVLKKLSVGNYMTEKLS